MQGGWVEVVSKISGRDFQKIEVYKRQHDNFISINNAVDIDLFGQVSSETSGTKQISGRCV